MAQAVVMESEAESLDWHAVVAAIAAKGYALTPQLFDEASARRIASLYEDEAVAFRSRIDMARHNFGEGEYKYFDYPLPAGVQALRERLYPPLARVANCWQEQLGSPLRWPATLAEFLDECHRQGQARPTPLILRYEEGGYNCLHQDLYGEVYFPLQVIVQLSQPGVDFDGGELLLVQQRPRMQSRATIVPLQQGQAAIIPVREMPRQGKRGYHRVAVRHGVSTIHRGKRTTLGIIFHDAK